MLKIPSAPTSTDTSLVLPSSKNNRTNDDDDDELSVLLLLLFAVVAPAPMEPALVLVLC